MNCPTDHNHGKNANCYTSHRCRCDKCRAMQVARQTRRRKQIAYGRYRPRMSATGTARRIEALMTLGWSQAEIGKRLGWSRQRVSELRHVERVSPEVHDAIAALYRALWLQRPTTSTVSIRRTKAAAKKANMAGPLAWDDFDNDSEPSSAPELEMVIDEVAIELATGGHHVQLSPDERRIALTQLCVAKLNDHEIAARLHINVRTVLRIRAELGIPASVGPNNQIIIREAAA